MIAIIYQSDDDDSDDAAEKGHTLQSCTQRFAVALGRLEGPNFNQSPHLFLKLWYESRPDRGIPLTRGLAWGPEASRACRDALACVPLS